MHEPVLDGHVQQSRDFSCRPRIISANNAASARPSVAQTPVYASTSVCAGQSGLIMAARHPSVDAKSNSLSNSGKAGMSIDAHSGGSNQTLRDGPRRI